MNLETPNSSRFAAQFTARQLAPGILGARAKHGLEGEPRGTKWEWSTVGVNPRGSPSNRVWHVPDSAVAQADSGTLAAQCREHHGCDPSRSGGGPRGAGSRTSHLPVDQF